LSTTDRKQTPADGARFPKEHRLRKAAEFKAVYTAGRKSASPSFVVFVLPNGRNVSRYGLTTPRKLGRAHERNRIRRRVREILRRRRNELPAGVDVVLNPRRSVLERGFEPLRAELVSLLKES
jgi:ribonuclease P protein component